MCFWPSLKLSILFSAQFFFQTSKENYDATINHNLNPLVLMKFVLYLLSLSVLVPLLTSRQQKTPDCGTVAEVNNGLSLPEKGSPQLTLAV